MCVQKEKAVLARASAKPRDDDGHCTREGYARARHVAALWGGGDGARFAPPAWLVARAPTGTGAAGAGVAREQETLAPLADLIGEPVDARTHSTRPTAARLARAIARGRYCGASVLVCWKHSYIVKLLEQLGCGEEQGCPAKWSRKDFDTIVSVQYARSPPADDEQGGAPLWRVNGSVSAQHFEAKKAEDGGGRLGFLHI